MCSYGEFRKIARSVPDLALQSIGYACSERMTRHPMVRRSELLRRWMSCEIGVVFRKRASVRAER
jgi:hypothetical protein